HFPHDDRLARPGELEPEPDADCGEEGRDYPAVDLERVLEDEVAILDDLEDGHQHAAQDAVEEDRLLHVGVIATGVEACRLRIRVLRWARPPPCASHPSARGRRATRRSPWPRRPRASRPPPRATHTRRTPRPC